MGVLCHYLLFIYDSGLSWFCSALFIKTAPCAGATDRSRLTGFSFIMTPLFRGVFLLLSMSNLILQALQIDHSVIEKMAAITGAEGVQELGPTVVRLLGADSAAKLEIKALCAQAKVDFAWIEPIHYLREMKILAMDMDSTLINIECIDE